MPYITGVINSFSDLRAQIVGLLTSYGWEEEGSIVKKNDIYAKLTTGFGTTYGAEYIDLQAGRYSDGAGNLVDTPTHPNGGAFSNNSGRMSEEVMAGFQEYTLAWPAVFHLHLMTSPVDEFWCFIQYNGNYCQHMGFGNLIKAANYEGGQFYHAIFNRRETNLAAGTSGGYGFRQIRIQFATTNYTGTMNGIIPFGGTSCFNSQGQYTGLGIHAEVGDVSWFSGCDISSYAPSTKRMVTHEHLYEQYNVSDNGPDSKVQTIPIRIYGLVRSGNYQKLGECYGLRYTRVGGVDFGEVFSDGTDTWKYYPVFFKDESDIDPDEGDAHSGTYGLAVRYDGG
jgi:hypothetical protein